MLISGEPVDKTGDNFFYAKISASPIRPANSKNPPLGGFLFYITCTCKSTSSFFKAISIRTQSILCGIWLASAILSHAHFAGPRCCSISSQYLREFWGFQKMWWYWQRHTTFLVSAKVWACTRLLRCSAWLGPEQFPRAKRSMQPPSRSITISRRSACIRLLIVADVPFPSLFKTERFRPLFTFCLKGVLLSCFVPRLRVLFHWFILRLYH